MKLLMSIMILTVLLAQPAFSGAFVKGEGKTNLQYVYTETITRNLVGENGIIQNPRGLPVAEPAYDILTLQHTLKGTYGVKPNMEVSLTGIYKAVDGETKDFQGITDIQLDYKYLYLKTGPVYYATSIGYHSPGKDYETQFIDAPGTHSWAIPIGIHFSYLDYAKMPATFGLEVKYEFREGDVPDATKYLLDAYYLHRMFSFGVFYGGMKTTGGIALDSRSPRWLEERAKNGNKNPFHLLAEIYNFVGAGIYYNHSLANFGLTYVEKLAKGMKNSDINSGVSFSVSYDCE